MIENDVKKNIICLTDVTKLYSTYIHTYSRGLNFCRRSAVMGSYEKNVVLNETWMFLLITHLIKYRKHLRIIHDNFTLKIRHNVVEWRRINFRERRCRGPHKPYTCIRCEWDGWTHSGQGKGRRWERGEAVMKGEGRSKDWWFSFEIPLLSQYWRIITLITIFNRSYYMYTVITKSHTSSSCLMIMLTTLCWWK